MTTGSDGQPVELSDAAKGFGYSVYFFLLLVFSVIGAIAFFVVRTMIREERQRAEREKAAASAANAHEE